MTLRQTHTYVLMDVSPATFEEIRGKLEEADYGHAINKERDEVHLDMHGIGLRNMGVTGESAASPADEVKKDFTVTGESMEAMQAEQGFPEEPPYQKVKREFSRKVSDSHKRWRVEIFYKKTKEPALRYVEELEELGDLIEGGPDYARIKKIKIKYNL